MARSTHVVLENEDVAVRRAHRRLHAADPDGGDRLPHARHHVAAWPSKYPSLDICLVAHWPVSWEDSLGQERANTEARMPLDLYPSKMATDRICDVGGLRSTARCADQHCHQPDADGAKPLDHHVSPLQVVTDETYNKGDEFPKAVEVQSNRLGTPNFAAPRTRSTVAGSAQPDRFVLPLEEHQRQTALRLPQVPDPLKVLHRWPFPLDNARLDLGPHLGGRLSLVPPKPFGIDRGHDGSAGTNEFVSQFALKPHGRAQVDRAVWTHNGSVWKPARFNRSAHACHRSAQNIRYCRRE